MIVSFLSDSLSKKISFLNHAVSTKAELPILTNFLLIAKDGKLNIHATDLEIGISSSITANVEKEGSTTVPAKNFSDLFANLGSQKITLSLEENTLKLKGEKVRATFQTMSPEDFPKLYEDKGEEIALIKKQDLEKYFSRSVFATAQDTSRPALSGMLIDKEKKEALIVATDSFRLSLQKNAFKTKEELDKPIIVPARLARELLLIKEDEPSVSFYVSEENNQALFVQGETSLVGRLIDDTYPPYEKIIPTDFSTKLEVDREDLINAIKICSVFARETANIIKLSVEKGKIIVSANSPSVGEDVVEVEAKTEGEENEIAFNAKYVLDILSSVDEESLIFEMTGPLNPGVFKIKGDDSFLHLIMPIRVQG